MICQNCRLLDKASATGYGKIMLKKRVVVLKPHFIEFGEGL